MYSEQDKTLRFPKIITPSKWRFVGSEGADASFTLPGAEVGVGVSMNSIYLKHEEQSKNVRLSLMGVGGVAGLGLIPCPLSYSYAEKDFYSSGKIFKLFAAGYDLSLDELRGPCLFGSVGGDVVVGGSAVAMYCGFTTTIPLSPQNLPLILMTSKAYFVMAGETRSILPVNVGLGAYFGVLT